MLYGAPRDLLLGLRFINGRGYLISTGGKVVKNVAGYDMTRLLAGSAGTLGFITEITFRIAMIPERCAAVTACGTLDACSAGASEFIRSNLEPAFIVALPDDTGKPEIVDSNWKIIIGFEGLSKTVDYQSERSIEILASQGLKIHDRNPYRTYNLHESMFDEYYEHMDRSPFILRAGLPLDMVTGFAGGLANLLPDAKIFADFGCGKILAGIDGINNGEWFEICDLSARCAGNLILEKAPDDFKRRHDVFGSPRPEWKLMHSIKALLDPHDIFSPGCLPGKK
jgi:FAD/FMN-containing dehydrogenase